MSQAPFAYMQMSSSAAVQNPPWLRAASSAGLGWGGMGELLLSIYSTSEDRETGLPQLPATHTGLELCRVSTKTVRSGTWLSSQPSGSFSAGLEQEATPVSRILSPGELPHSFPDPENYFQCSHPSPSRGQGRGQDRLHY